MNLGPGLMWQKLLAHVPVHQAVHVQPSFHKLDPLHACVPVEHPGAVLHARVLLSFHAGCSC